MIVLDTTIVSELMRADADMRVLAWVDDQLVSDLVITAVTAAELRSAVSSEPDPGRRELLADRIESLLEETFADAVLAFDAESSRHYAEVVFARRLTGLPIAALDAQIAAICRQHSADLATRNGRDFIGAGITLIDPWTARPS